MSAGHMARSPAGGARKQKDGSTLHVDGGNKDKPGFRKSATLKDIESHDFVLTPGCYSAICPTPRSKRMVRG